MERMKAISAVWIIGLLFSLLGGIFLVLGIALLFFLKNTPAWMVGLVFAGIGGLFLALGIVFLCIEEKKRRTHRQLQENGRHIWGVVVALEPNIWLRINNRHPFYAVVRCTDPFGRVTMFQSESSMALWHRDDLTGRQVKVYVKDDTYKSYYVDISSLL